jgi:hypothetical protein
MVPAPPRRSPSATVVRDGCRPRRRAMPCAPPRHDVHGSVPPLGEGRGEHQCCRTGKGGAPGGRRRRSGRSWWCLLRRGVGREEAGDASCGARNGLRQPPQRWGAEEVAVAPYRERRSWRHSPRRGEGREGAGDADRGARRGLRRPLQRWEAEEVTAAARWCPGAKKGGGGEGKGWGAAPTGEMGIRVLYMDHC